MKKTIILTSIILILLVAPLISAEQQIQQTNKIYLNPFYRISMQQDGLYNYTLNFNPPDNVQYVHSAIITFQMFR